LEEKQEEEQKAAELEQKLPQAKVCFDLVTASLSIQLMIFFQRKRTTKSKKESTSHKKGQLAQYSVLSVCFLS
jgi:hypothetical protein